VPAPPPVESRAVNGIRRQPAETTLAVPSAGCHQPPAATFSISNAFAPLRRSLWRAHDGPSRAYRLSIRLRRAVPAEPLRHAARRRRLAP
jgi:hypothetical protein